MKIKVTIQLDDEKFSASTTGPGDSEEPIGRAVAACFAAIGGTDGNLSLPSLLAESVLAAWDAPDILRAAAQAWRHHNLEPRDHDNWAVLVADTAWHPVSRHELPLHLPFRVDMERLDALLQEMSMSQDRQDDEEATR